MGSLNQKKFEGERHKIMDDYIDEVNRVKQSFLSVEYANIFDDFITGKITWKVFKVFSDAQQKARGEACQKVLDLYQKKWADLHERHSVSILVLLKLYY